MRETDTHCFFYTNEFSQWHMQDMIDRNGITFNCCEQYMMFHKAILFEDKTTAEMVLNADHPREQKKLGREVADFDVGVWNRNCFSIVWEANWLKFTQHQKLKDMLIMTQGKELVEASRYDKIWGIGLAVDDDRVLDINKWDGTNFLGKALDSVREGIIATL